MPVTRIQTQLIKDGGVTRDDLNTATTGQAVVRKIIAGTNVTLSSTGVDAGTGDVTINASASGGSAYTGTPTRLGSVDFGNSFTVVGNTNTSTTVNNLTSTSRLYVGMSISGTNIPASTTISSIDSATAITISQAATGTTSSVTFTFNAATSSTMVAGPAITIYTVPASNYVQMVKLSIANRSADPALVFVGHNGTAAANCIVSGMLILANEVKQITLPGLQAADTIRVLSDTSDVNFTLTGLKGTTAINQQKLASLYIDGATKLINTDYVLYVTTAARSVSLIVCNESSSSSANIRAAHIGDDLVAAGTSITEGSNAFYKSDYIIYDDTLLPNETRIYEGEAVQVGFVDMATEQSIVVRSNSAGVNFILWRAQ
jgi:hypothetical protein